MILMIPFRFMSNYSQFLLPFTYYYQIIITVHDPVDAKKYSDRSELKAICHKIIYSALPPIYHNNNDTNSIATEKKKN